MIPSDKSIAVTRSALIARPCADVFTAMTDPRVIPRWLSSVFDAEPVMPAPLRQGSDVWCLVKLHGQRMRVEGRWVEFQPPHTGTFATLLSPLKAEMTVTCTQQGSNTLAQIDIGLGKGVFFGLKPTFISDVIGRMLEYDLGTLKIILEPPVSTLRL